MNTILITKDAVDYLSQEFGVTESEISDALPVAISMCDIKDDAPAPNETDAATDALTQIAKLCGCEHWEYPGQVVNDVRTLTLAASEFMRVNEMDGVVTEKEWIDAYNKLNASFKRASH